MIVVRPDPPPSAVFQHAARQFRDAEYAYRNQANQLRAVSDQINGMWAGNGATSVANALQGFGRIADNFAASSAEVAGTLENVAGFIGLKAEERRSAIAQLRKLERQRSVTTTLDLFGAERELGRIDAQIEGALQHAADTVRAAAAKAKWWSHDVNVNPSAMWGAVVDSTGYAIKSFGTGVGDGSIDMVTGLWQLASNPGAAFAGMVNIARDPTGAMASAADQLVKEWQGNPAHAMGTIIPGLAAALFTGGTGAVAARAGSASAALERAAVVGRASIAGRVADSVGVEVRDATIPKGWQARHGQAFSANPGGSYREIFFAANPTVAPERTIVHHAIEQQVLREYPGLFTREQLDSAANLRGIPMGLNNDLHLSLLRREWDSFYTTVQNPTASDFRRFARYLDKKYGQNFNPPL